MVGFGRAVGETMIVLMATGNTPVLDWSPFNGMRTLSANIAVEVPEAPYGGHALPRPLPLRLRPLPDDVPRQHARGARPPAPRATSTRPSERCPSRDSTPRAAGEHLIWLTGSALGICLLMIVGLLAVDPVERPRHLLAVADRAAHAQGRLGPRRRARPAAGDPEPRPAGPPEEPPPPAQGRQPRPVRARLQVGRRVGRREARGARRASSSSSAASTGRSSARP